MEKTRQIDAIKKLILNMSEEVNAGRLPDVIDEYFAHAVIAPPDADPIVVDPQGFRDECEAVKDVLKSEWVVKSFNDVHVSGDIALVRVMTDWIEHNLAEETRTVHERENTLILRRKGGSWEVLLETYADRSVKHEQ